MSGIKKAQDIGTYASTASADGVVIATGEGPGQRAFAWRSASREEVFPAARPAVSNSSIGHGPAARSGDRAHADSAAQKPARPSLDVINRDLRSPLQLAADVLVIVVLAGACGMLYNALAYDSASAVQSVRDFLWAGMTVALLLVTLERFDDGQRDIAVTTAFDRLRSLLKGWSLAFAALLFILFALKSSANLSRGFLLSFYFVGVAVVGAWRAWTPPVIARWTHKLGYDGGAWIVVGAAGDPAADDFMRELSANDRPAPTLIRFDADGHAGTWEEQQRSVLAQAASAVREGRGPIYLCAAGAPEERLASIGQALSILPVAIRVLPDAAMAGFVRCKPVTAGSRVAVEVRRAPMSRWQRLLKRTIDIGAALFLLLALSSVLLAIAVAIKLDSPGPVLFCQARKGQRGKPFRIFKFRTMHVLEDGPVVEQARRNDPRVTRIGRVLRAKSLDELPQLWNVLKGEMSLVGPRPHAVAHDESYAKSIPNYEVRQHVKPGITGWAQVHGLRGETSHAEQMRRRIAFDIWYAVNASLLLDCEILVRTLFEVWRGRNAY